MHLNDEALMALPFIGALVGVDQYCPTKAVYDIYDISITSLRFVHGDGIFISSEQVSFMKAFKNGIPEQVLPLF